MCDFSSLDSLFAFLNLMDELEKEIRNPKPVNVQGCIEFTMKTGALEHTVESNTRDMCLIVDMLHDYVRRLEQTDSKDPRKDYYIERFKSMAKSFSEQLDYDYEDRLEKCLKKSAAGQSDESDQSDVGGDAFAYLMKSKKKISSIKKQSA